MNPISDRFNKEVCETIIDAIWETDNTLDMKLQSPIVRYALSAHAPAELKENVISSIFEHLQNQVEAAQKFDIFKASLEEKEKQTSPSLVSGDFNPSAPDSFPAYVNTPDGYYVAPNSLFMKAFREFPDHFTMGARVVDLGSGTGRNALVSALAGADISLIEYSAAGNLFAQKQARDLGVSERVHAATMLMQDWEPSEGAYDAVVTITTLEHLSRADRQLLRPKIEMSLVPGGILVAAVFLDDDPGALNAAEGASETADHVISYFAHGELSSLFSDMEILHYSEYRKLDTSHGAPHYHSRADLIARKLPA